MSTDLSSTTLTPIANAVSSVILRVSRTNQWFVKPDVVADSHTVVGSMPSITNRVSTQTASVTRHDTGGSCLRTDGGDRAFVLGLDGPSRPLLELRIMAGELPVVSPASNITEGAQARLSARRTVGYDRRHGSIVSTGGDPDASEEVEQRLRGLDSL